MDIYVEKIGKLEIVDFTSEAVFALLFAHPRVKRVWFNDQTGEFAALTDEGMAVFTIGFPDGDRKTFS